MKHSLCMGVREVPILTIPDFFLPQNNPLPCCEQGQRSYCGPSLLRNWDPWCWCWWGGSLVVTLAEDSTEVWVERKRNHSIFWCHYMITRKCITYCRKKNVENRSSHTQRMTYKLVLSSKVECIYSLQHNSTFTSRETLPCAHKEIWSRLCNSTTWKREELETISTQQQENKLCDTGIKKECYKIIQLRETNQTTCILTCMELTNMMLNKTTFKIIPVIYHLDKVTNLQNYNILLR